uniref:Uncharacterized protein n=1 Tax=Timema tahoe TaxID=61484 RepID=A0A7R9FF82_9NEOP|nr:unnamed protein product [Timema tahoe]
MEEIKDEGSFTPPTPEQLLAVLGQLQGLTDEDREELKRELMQRVAGGSPAAPLVVEDGGLSMFFGYKLYKSLKEKERKKDEKKKLKQQKKKK